MAAAARRRMAGTILPALVQAGWLLLAPAAPAGADPAPETLARLQEATRPIRERDFRATYTVTYRNMQCKPDGTDPDERRAVLAAQKRGPGRPDVTLVRATRNGQDLTEESRARIEALQGELDGSDDPRAARVRMSEVLGMRPPAWVRMLRSVTGGDRDPGPGLAGYRLPGPSEAGTYVFGATERGGDVCVASFSPAPELEDAERVVSGRLAWDCDSRDPLWLEAGPASLPTFVQEMAVRLDFERGDEILFVRRLDAAGMGGFLFYKRRFESGFEITDFREVEPDEDPAAGTDTEA